MDLVYPGPPNPHVWTRCVLCPVNFFTSMLSSVQLLSCVQLFLTPWTAARQASLSITNSWSLPKLIELVMPSNHLILCHPLLLLSSIFANIGVFSNESALCIRWPKYWSFSFNISPSNEHPGLISFRMDWLDLLAVQGTLKSLLQHHSSKAKSWTWLSDWAHSITDPYIPVVDSPGPSTIPCHPLHVLILETSFPTCPKTKGMGYYQLSLNHKSLSIHSHAFQFLS